MDIAVLGAGAMGILFGGYLSERNNVVLVGRNKENMESIKRDGVIIREKDEREKVYFPNATVDTDEIKNVDLVILFVKSGNSEEVLEKHKNIIGKNTVLMTLQNGAGHEEILCRYANRENVVIGTTQQGSFRIDYRTVCHSGGGNSALGAICGKSERFKYIAGEFEKCGFMCEVSDNVGYMIWNKIMINASSSILSGLLQVSQGYVAENKNAWNIAEKLIEEICIAADCQGYKFDMDEQKQRLYDHLKNAPDGLTSIYDDIKNGRKTEVRKINGAVIEAAKSKGISLPVNETIFNLVTALEGKF